MVCECRSVYDTCPRFDVLVIGTIKVMSVVPDAVCNAVQLSYKYTILELLTYQLVWSRFAHIYNVDIDPMVSFFRVIISTK